MSRRCAELSKTSKGAPMYSFRGSEFGGCFHSQVQGLRGVSPENFIPPSLQKVFDYGHADEKRMKDILHSLGVKFTPKSMNTEWSEQEAVALKRGMGEKGFLLLRCSLDGIVSGISKEKLLLAKGYTASEWLYDISIDDPVAEFNNYDHKALNDVGFEKFIEDGIEAFPRYSWQFSAGTHGLRREKPEYSNAGLLITVAHRPKAREDGVIYSEDSKGWAVAYYAEPPFSEKQCLDRCEAVVDLYLRGECPKCDNEYPCRYPKAELQSLEDAEVAELLQRYADAKSEADYFERLRASLEPLVHSQWQSRGDFRAGVLGVRGYRKGWELVKYERE